MHLKQKSYEELFEKVFWLREVAEQHDDLFTSGAVNMKKEVPTQGRKWHLKRKEETSMQQRQGRQQQRHEVSWASDSGARLSVTSSRASFPVSLAHLRRWHGTVPQKCLLQSALWYRVHINNSHNTPSQPHTHQRLICLSPHCDHVQPRPPQRQGHSPRACESHEVTPEAGTPGPGISLGPS